VNIAQLLPALLRTLVPLIYGLLIQWGLGKVMPDQYVTWVATAILLAGVYLVLRILEHYQRYVGIVLGWVGAPQYANVVQGEVLAVHDQLETITKGDLAQLRDELTAAIEQKVTAATEASAQATARHVAKAASSAKKTAAAKGTAKKAAAR
jgi:hypothetical protein